jgi:hypothetical protein
MRLHRDVLIEFGARQDASDSELPAAKKQVQLKIRELAGLDPKPVPAIQEQQQILSAESSGRSG